MEAFWYFFISNFSKIFAIFSSFLNLKFFLFFFRHQGPGDLLQGLMISCRIVSRVNGMVFNILLTPALAIFFDEI